MKFFLTADSDKLKSQIKSKKNWVSKLANKFGNNDEAVIDDLKLEAPENKNNLSPEEKKNLNLFLDNMKVLQAKNTANFNQIDSLLKNVSQKFLAFRNSLYQLADLFHKVNETYGKIEELCEGKFEGFEKQSEVYQKLEVGFYSFGEFFDRSEKNMKKCISPLIHSVLKDSGHVHSV